MSHTAYWITPDDVAVYLFLENTSHQRENEILWDLFENHKTHIPTEYGSTYLQFKQSVMNLLNTDPNGNRAYFALFRGRI